MRVGGGGYSPGEPSRVMISAIRSSVIGLPNIRSIVAWRYRSLNLFR